MEIDRAKASEIVSQVQAAHRMCGAFYDRLFPTLDNLGNELNCTFKLWNPLYRDRPCKSGTNPSGKWFWDMLPMIAARFVYSSGEPDQAEAGDYIIEIEVVIEEAVTKEFKKKHRVTGTTDPILLPKAESYVMFYIYRAVEFIRHDIIESWNNCKYPDHIATEFVNVGEGIEALGIKVPMVDFLVDDKVLIHKLKEIVGLAA